MLAQFSLCKKLNLLNSLCFPCLEKLTAKFPVFPVPWPPCLCWRCNRLFKSFSFFPFYSRLCFAKSKYTYKYRNTFPTIERAISGKSCLRICMALQLFSSLITSGCQGPLSFNWVNPCDTHI